MTTELYNPLTYENLMAGLAAHFQQIPMNPLSRATGGNPVASGPGVYALYYFGDMRVYRSISDGMSPIYVGKAEPPGGRKGGGTLNTDAPALHNRLRDHAKSVGDARNLDLDNFQYRALAVEPVWIRLAERFLIERHTPVWNHVLDGFGKHASGKNRRGGERSWWDTLHPGRPWAMKESSTRTAQDARMLIQQFFAQ